MAGETGKFIGGLKFGVSMDTRKLSKDTKKAKGIIQKFTGSVKKAIFSVKGFGAALGAGIFINFTADAFRAIDSLAKVSDKLGVTTEALAGLRLAAEESGVASNTLDMALQRMVRRVAEASIGLGEARDALKTLGLDAKTLAALSPDKQFRAIADSMSKVSDNGERIRLAFKLFDSEGVALVNTLKLGKAGLDETAQAARDLGLAVGRESAKDIEKSIDAFNRLKLSISGVFRGIAVELAPEVERLSKALLKLVQGPAVQPMSSLFHPHRRSPGRSAIQTFQGIFGESRSRTLPGPENSQFRTPAGVDASARLAEGRRIIEERKAKAGSTVRGVRALLGQLGVQGKNFGRGLAGGGQGIANLPIFKVLPTVLSNLANTIKADKKQSIKRNVDNSRGTLSFAEAGSAESFRQRARTRNQNEQKKLDIKRNATLLAIKDSLANGNGATLSIANL